MKTKFKKCLSMLITALCFNPNISIAEEWGAWHLPFNIATLVPIYEPYIWNTNCEQLDGKRVREIVQMIENEKIIPTSSAEYTKSSIRIILFSIEKIYHINQQFQLKEISNNKISYYKLNPNSDLIGILQSTFNQCKPTSR